jgi:hypothetical protein
MLPTAMSRTLLLCTTAAVLLLLAVPTTQAQETQTYEVSAGVSAVSVSVQGRASVEQGTPAALRIEGPKEILDKIEVSDRSGTLRVAYQDRGLLERLFGGSRDFDEDDAVTVHVTLPQIHALDAGGSTLLTSEQTIEGETLRLHASGASELSLDAAVGTLTLKASGAGDARVRGTARRAEIHASGAGSVHADSLTVETATADASGAGSIRVHVTGRLDASASGAGDITYHGSPEVSRQTSGAGSVKIAERGSD